MLEPTLATEKDAEGLVAAIAAAPVAAPPRSDTPAAEAARDRAEAAAPEFDPATREALRKIERVYVAVHGIGDQYQYATIQQVANRLARYYDVAAPIPLGSFHSKTAGEVGFLLLKSPPYDPRLVDVGLAEIYWADIPRAVQKEGYKLEESKKWASSLTGRIRLRAEANQRQFVPAVYETIEQVIDEIIQGVAVLDRLFFLLGKVTTFKFRLKDLLDAFLGDVQIVTDFETQRGQLLGHFNAVMEKIHKANEDVEIYFVAHSEGTVVTFLGLLTAFHEYGSAGDDGKPKYRWIEQVRGLMTIGSPIEEHLILWPELFQPFECRKDPNTGAQQPAYNVRPEKLKGPIRWRNYCDKGDPIAYRLVETENWLKRNGWDRVFEFDRDRHEFVFSRYPFPGKAHNDYWEDAEVFGHFIDDVVKPPGVGERTAKPKPPRSDPLVALFSRVVPYLVPALLLFTGVFLLFRGVRTFLVGPNQDDTFGYTLQNAIGYWSLFAGLTLAARVPRLTRSWWAWGASLAMFLAGLIGYSSLVTVDNQEYLTKVPVHRVLSLVQGKEPADLAPGRAYTIGLVGFSGIVCALVLIAQGAALLRPRLGAKTLIIPGLLAVVAVAGSRVAGSMSERMSDRGSLGGMVLGGALFLYLWWLSVVFFDLIFVWHHYVRGSARGATAVDRLRVMCAEPERKHRSDRRRRKAGRSAAPSP